MDDETRAYLDDMRRELMGRFDANDRRFETMDGRFDAIDGRFDAIDRRFETMDRRFDAIDGRFEIIDRRFETIDRRFETIDGRFDAVDGRFETVERRITAEAEETRRHFGVVAEFLRSDIKLLVDGLEVNSRATSVLRAEMHAEFQARDVVLHAGFTQMRRDLEDVRRRL